MPISNRLFLDQLLPQHDDAQLDAELHQAAPRGALQERVASSTHQPASPCKEAGPSGPGLSCVLHVPAPGASAGTSLVSRVFEDETEGKMEL